MRSAGDVDKGEVEEEGPCNPAVNRSVRLDIGVVQHSLDVLRIYFDDELSHADDP